MTPLSADRHETQQTDRQIRCTRTLMHLIVEQNNMNDDKMINMRSDCCMKEVIQKGQQKKKQDQRTRREVDSTEKKNILKSSETAQ